jgi:hypothetical protein
MFRKWQGREEKVKDGGSTPHDLALCFTWNSWRTRHFDLSCTSTANRSREFIGELIVERSSGINTFDQAVCAISVLGSSHLSRTSESMTTSDALNTMRLSFKNRTGSSTFNLESQLLYRLSCHCLVPAQWHKEGRYHGKSAPANLIPTRRRRT